MNLAGGRNSAHKSEEADRLVFQASLRGRAGLVRLGETRVRPARGSPGRNGVGAHPAASRPSTAPHPLLRGQGEKDDADPNAPLQGRGAPT